MRESERQVEGWARAAFALVGRVGGRRGAVRVGAAGRRAVGQCWYLASRSDRFRLNKSVTLMDRKCRDCLVAVVVVAVDDETIGC